MSADRPSSSAGSSSSPVVTGGRSSSSSMWRPITQLVGFLAGVFMLAWCVRIAFKPEHREQLSALIDAPWEQLALVMALSASTIFINGCLFWLATASVRRVPFLDVQAINAVAYLLSNLPLKIGLLFRIAAHHRRNRVPVLACAGWFGAVAVLLLATVSPALVASLLRPGVDSLWWTIWLGGAALLSVGIVVVSRYFSAGRGWVRLERFITTRETLRPQRPGRVLSRNVLERMREALRMLGNPAVVASSAVLRVLDIVVQAARFVIVADILGLELSADHAVLAATVYFLVETLAPTGALGVREAGTIGALGLLANQSFNVVVLAVSAAEMVVRILLMGLGVLWLRPDKLLRQSRLGLEEPARGWVSGDGAGGTGGGVAGGPASGDGGATRGSPS